MYGGAATAVGIGLLFAACSPADDGRGADAAIPDQRAALLAAANAVSLERGRLAMERASHPHVRELACRWRTAAEAERARLRELLRPEMFEADASPDARALHDQGAEWLLDARRRWGMSLDRAYLLAEREYAVWLGAHAREWSEHVASGSAEAGLIAELAALSEARLRDLDRLDSELVGFAN